VSRHLSSDGFDVIECGDGRQVLEHVTSSRFDLIVLDGELSGLDGIALCRAIRRGSANACSPILIVATSSVESDKVLAFANGADDYITKPLRIREFLARVTAVIRRTQRVTDHSERGLIHGPNIRLDPSRRRVVVRESVVVCSKREFDLLYALASSPGIVFSREQLVTRYWRDGRDVNARLIDSIICRLRRKIERDPELPELIITVWGSGYKFSE
jgi:two-component system alkaline phosphatase synthesis response regulator PhoP